MNKNIKILQFLAVQRSNIMARFINKCSIHDAVIILDLEDALWDVSQPEHTLELKAQGRRELVKFAQNYPNIFLQKKIGVRLNKNYGSEFINDLIALEQIADTVKFENIVLTKIESSRDIVQCITQLSEHRIRYNTLVLIVETKTGINNLGEIVYTAQENNIEYIVFGHYDYSLDTDQWPFLDFTETGFWEHTIPIIHQIEAGHVTYIHPPFFQIYDDRQFEDNFYRLSNLCKQSFGIITLTEQQTRLCSKLSKNVPTQENVPLQISKVYQDNELVDLAESVKQSYEIRRHSHFSFALDRKTRKFISPHVYLAAVNYLEKKLV